MAFNQTKFFDGLEQLAIKTVEKGTEDKFVFEFLDLLDKPKATITQLKKTGSRINVAKDHEAGEVAYRAGFYFKPSSADKLEELKQELAQIKQLDVINSAKIRMIIVTNFKEVVLYDTKMNESLETDFLELYKDYSFLLPLAGLERATEYSEHPADVKAAEKMGRLFDQLKNLNKVDNSNETQVYSLNSFFVRVLFCLFAEDTGIFEKNQFHDVLVSTTNEDGGDTAELLSKLFEVLDASPDSEVRLKAPTHLAQFPYVNGSLFKEKIVVPSFDRRTRRLLLSCSEMNWAEINPDIFGSMFQAVVNVEQRGNLGQHYTSVPNIMKVISPLFLDELREEFEKIKNLLDKNASRDRKWERLEELHNRIADIRCFDPACGSANFLIIAYKELRQLEIEILELKQERLKGKNDAPLLSGFENTLSSRISLNNYYGIEYDEFPSQIAKLSLWLAEHQMNLRFQDKFGFVPATLPLKDSGHIIHGNALRVDWNEVCPNNGTDEIYIIGNPPFGGHINRSKEQSEDMDFVFKGFKPVGYLDYVGCWFWKGAQYIAGTRAKMALVSTNSISQGMQVATIFPPIFDLGIEIEFAYQTFPWRNNAKHNAAVHVVIIGLSDKSNINKKTIFSLPNKEWHSEIVDNISPYLILGANITVSKTARPLHGGSEMIYGNMPRDGGGLILSTEEKNKALAEHPNAKKYVKKLLGADEFLNGKERWCLWLEGDDIDLREARSYPFIEKRLEFVKNNRLESRAKSTRDYADKPHLFVQRSQPKSGDYILVPMITSERRDYIPMGFFDASVICTNRNFMIPNGTLFDFGLISSEAHMDWMRLVAGRMKSDYSYTNTIVYNTFPFPEVNEEQKKHIEYLAEEILMAREGYPHKTLAQLYDPDKMPDDLLNAHRELDRAVDELYKAGRFRNASERVEHLLKLYEKAVAEEKGVK